MEEQAQKLKERQEQGSQLDASLKECKDKLLASEQRIEQLEGLNKVCDDSLSRVQDVRGLNCPLSGVLSLHTFRFFETNLVF